MNVIRTWINTYRRRNAHFRISQLKNSAIIIHVSQKPFNCFALSRAYNICQYVWFVKDLTIFRMDITYCECYSYSYSRPHLSGLRSNYSSEINQFYKSKIQSHVPWLLYPYMVAQCTYCICLCERPNRHLTMVLKNSFVECNLKLHMDKLVHLANMFTIQRDGDNRRVKGSESTTIASGYTHSTTLNKSRIILTLISYISVANVDLNGNKINAYILFVFLPSMLIAHCSLLSSTHLISARKYMQCTRLQLVFEKSWQLMRPWYMW